MILVKYRFSHSDGTPPQEPHRHRSQSAPRFQRGSRVSPRQTGAFCLQVCSRGRDRPISLSRRIGLTPGYSISGDLSLMRISIRLSAPQGHKILASAATSNRASGYRTGPTNLRTLLANGSSALCLYVALLTRRNHRRSYSARQRRQRSVGGNHNLRRRASGNARSARDGLGRCAFQRINVHARPQSHQFRNHATVSDAPLRKGGTMNRKNFALIILIWNDGWPDGPGTNQTHRDARRGHDLKLLSIRGETTPRAPVWRSNGRS